MDEDYVNQYIFMLRRVAARSASDGRHYGGYDARRLDGLMTTFSTYALPSILYMLFLEGQMFVMYECCVHPSSKYLLSCDTLLAC